MLLAVLAVEVVIAVTAGLARELRQTARWGIPFAFLVMAINVLVSRDGATVIFRGPYLPWAGQIDFTLEALVYGAVLGLRILAIFGSAIFLTAAVDNDELLRALRRVSLRSGVTAALAMRLFGVLKRDAARLADAQRCLPGGGASRLQVLHAVTTGALDRATDVAATLEVRGFGAGGRPPRMPRPWSRHDLAFAASATAIVALLLIGELGGAAGFEWSPRLEGATLPAAASLSLALAAVALAPFADRRGIER
jgi:energy-coupling factor transport system permease protein